MCNSVSDREIRYTVAEGAQSFEAVQAVLGVATCCGRCRDCARRIVTDAARCAEPVGAGDD